MKKFAIAACMALLFIGSGFAYATPASYLSVDINPSVELGIDTFGLVVSAEALNKDGEDVLSGINVKGTKVKKAVNIIVDAAADKGFLKDDGVVLITAANDDKEKADKLTKDAKEGTEEALTKNETSAEVSQAAISLARRDAAREAGISPGKMNLIQKLWEATEGEAATANDFNIEDGNIYEFAEDYADTSVKDIMDEIKDARIDAKLDAADANDSAEDGTGKATAPGQLKKDVVDTGDQNSTTLPNGKIKNIAPDENDDEE